MVERAGTAWGDGWTVTLWTQEQAAGGRDPAAVIRGIDRRDTALLTAARALVGADVFLPRCAVAQVEGWDSRRRERVRWRMLAGD